jgi:transposase
MEYQDTLFQLPEQDLPEKIVKNGRRKLLKAHRDQVEIRYASLDEMIELDHPVRQVWEYVEALDLSKALNIIHTFEGEAGRPAIDPKIIVALWLYATIEGIGSARVLVNYTQQHLAYKWLCGDVSIERKTISDFRVKNSELFDDLLAQGIAILLRAGAVTLKEIAQDGLRVRAHAGGGSFRREQSLEKLYKEAKERIAFLKREIEEDTSSCSARIKLNRIRAAEEKLNNIKRATVELQKIKHQKNESLLKSKKKVLTIEQEKELRVSTTDCEARVMKMPDGGFRPSFNCQLAVDTKANVIIGLDVVNAGTDGGQMLPMYETIKNRYGQVPERYLVDGGFKNKDDLKQLTKDGCAVYMPSRGTQTEKRDEVRQLHERMLTEEAKEIYRRRGSSVECVNAWLRNKGLYRIGIKGLKKAKAVLTMFCISHNMARTISLKLN